MVNQLLLWNAVSSAAAQVISLIVIAIIFWLVIEVYKTGDEENLQLAVIAGGLIAVALSLVFLNNFDWLKIWLAPKLYLIEYAASLVKK